jgi:hypothetical protein
MMDPNNGKLKGARTMDFTLWDVIGQRPGFDDDGRPGGSMVVAVLTSGRSTLPAPVAAIKAASSGESTFDSIDGIQRTGASLPSSWTSDLPRQPTVVNQTGIDMPQEAVESIARVIRQSHEHEIETEVLSRSLADIFIDGEGE